MVGLSVLVPSPMAMAGVLFSGGVWGLWKPWGSYGSPRDMVVPDDCALDDVDVDEAPAPDVGRVDVLGVLMDWVTDTLVGDEDFTTGERVW